MKSFPLLALGLGALFAVTPAPIRAEEPGKAGEEAFSIVPHGFAGIQSFRIHAWKNRGVEYPAHIFNNSVLNFTFDLVSGQHLSIKAGIEGYVTFSTVPYEIAAAANREELATPLWSWYMAQAEINYAVGSPDGIFDGFLGVGLFPYKYNEEARNLGEYLFRSGTYPGWLLTTFDWTATRLTGARAGGTLFGFWQNDLMLTTEMEWFPFYDLSLSWVSKLPVGKVLELGGGLSWARFLPANDSLTTPRLVNLTGNKQSPNYYNRNGTDTLNYDTAFYTFSGVKAMARATFDPKGFFDMEETGKVGRLGKEDGKLFAEVAVLGVQNQGPLYSDILQRMPVMFGFNFPTFNLLDVLALQAEYYAMPYPNDYSYQIKFAGYGVPQPYRGYGFGDPTSKYTVGQAGANYPNPIVDDRPNYYTRDNWKWSIYARRWLGRHLAIVGQAARDHWRSSTPFTLYRDTEEALSESDNWYAALKIVSVW